MRLISFLPCERLIIDKNGLISIIVIMQEMSTVVPPGVTVPNKAISPSTWWVAAMWRVEDTEGPGQYLQKLEIYWPDGSKYAEMDTPFLIEEGKPFATNGTQFRGFPIAQTGNLRLIAWIEKDGKTISSEAEFLIRINHVSQEKPQTATS